MSSKTSRSANGSKSQTLQLPPKLSPTLPPWADEILPRMLSPTLPAMFDELDSSQQRGSTASSKKSNDVPLHHPQPQRANSKKLSRTLGAGGGEDSDASGVSNAPSPAPSGPASLPAKPKPRNHNNHGNGNANDRQRQQQQQQPQQQTAIVRLKLAPEMQKQLTNDGRYKERGRSGSSTTSRPVGLGIQQESTGSKRKPTNSVSAASPKRPRVNREYSSSSSEEDVPLKAAAAKRSKGSVPASTTVNNTGPSTPKTSTPTANTPKLSSAKLPKRNSDSNEEETRKGATSRNTPVSAPAPAPAPPAASSAPVANRNGSTSTPKLQQNDSPKVANAKQDKRYKEVKQCASKWSMRARDKKHEGDRAHKEERPETAACLMLDALMAFIVGFDLEDRALAATKSLASPRMWESMIPYAGKTAAAFEPTVEGQAMAGLVYLLRSMIHGKIAWICQQQVKALQTSKTNCDANTQYATSLGPRYMQNVDAAMSDLKRGYAELPVEMIQREFPETWKKRSRQPISSGHYYECDRYHPEKDPFFLPMQAFSSLQEGSAFAYSMLKEWAEKNRVRYDPALLRE